MKNKTTTSFSFHLDNEKDKHLINYLKRYGTTNTVKRSLVNQMKKDLIFLEKLLDEVSDEINN